MNVDKLCQAIQCVVGFTHHAPHVGERMRGSVDIYGASEWSLFVNKSGKPPSEKITITQDRARWDKAIKSFAVHLKGNDTTFRVTYDGECELELDNQSKAFLDAIAKKPLGPTDISSKLNISRATYYRERDNLIGLGLISEQKIGNRVLISRLNGKA